MRGSGSSHPPGQPQGLTRLTEGRMHSGQEEAATSKGPAASWGAFFPAVRPGPGGHGPRPPGRPAQGRLSLAVCPSGHTGSSISYPPLSSIFQECEQGNRERRACARAAADPSCSGGRGGVAGSGASPRSRGWVRGGVGGLPTLTALGQGPPHARAAGQSEGRIQVWALPGPTPSCVMNICFPNHTDRLFHAGLYMPFFFPNKIHIYVRRSTRCLTYIHTAK